MTRFTVLFVLNFLLLTSWAQEKDNNIDLSIELSILIPSGKITVEILDSVKTTPRQIELALKFQNGIRNNYDWFINNMKKYPKGGMPYNAKLGVTEKEYEELKNFSENIELISKRIDTVEVIATDTCITFKTFNEKIKPLNSLRIYPRKNEVFLWGNKLEYSESPEITDEKNAFKSKWKGYTWRFERPKDFEMEDIKNLKSLNVSFYKVTLGRLEKDGRTFIIITGKEYLSGQPLKSNFEFPIILNY